MTVEAFICRDCGSTLAVRRPFTDSSGFTAPVCLRCLSERAESERHRIEEKSGLPYGEDTAPLGPGATDAEIEAELARTDAVHEIEMLLYWVGEQINSGRETINMTWMDGRVDEPQTEAEITLRHVRSFLTRSGYEEVSVVTGRTDEPALLAREVPPEGEPPHWSTNIIFRRVRAHSG
jgi:hypothetical protein